MRWRQIDFIPPANSLLQHLKVIHFLFERIREKTSGIIILTPSGLGNVHHVWGIKPFQKLHPKTHATCAWYGLSTADLKMTNIKTSMKKHLFNFCTLNTAMPGGFNHLKGLLYGWQLFLWYSTQRSLLPSPCVQLWSFLWWFHTKLD